MQSAYCRQTYKQTDKEADSFPSSHTFSSWPALPIPHDLYWSPFLSNIPLILTGSDSRLIPVVCTSQLPEAVLSPPPIQALLTFPAICPPAGHLRLLIPPFMTNYSAA